MRGLFIHTVVAAVVSALLVGVWLLTTGSTDELSHVQDDPVYYARHGFWPLIVATAWAGALVIHAAVWLTTFPGRGRGRDRRAARHARHRPPHPPAVPGAPASPDGAAPRVD